MQQSNPDDFAQHFPPVIGIGLLSQLLKRKHSVILIDRCSRPSTLPPACVIPGTRQPLWITSDVIEWLRQFQEKPQVHIGPPTKASRIHKRELTRTKSNQYP